MMHNKVFTLQEAHMEFAKKLNGRVWELLAKEDRTQKEDDEMIQAAHASLYHWLQVGTAVHQQRGFWMLAHVYTVLEHQEEALYNAERCLQITKQYPEQMQDFDFAYGFEGAARASALTGDRTKAAEYKKKASDAGEKIANEEDKSIFLGDLMGGNWYGVD